MSNSELKTFYQGTKFRIVHCEGAIESFQVAIGSVDKRKRDTFKRGIILQIERLANTGRLSRENFPQEGDLPKRPGQHGTKNFYALKRIPLRGYCWFSEVKPQTIFISHYIYKDFDKLKSSDTTRVGANWERIEVNGHER